MSTRTVITGVIRPDGSCSTCSGSSSSPRSADLSAADPARLPPCSRSPMSCCSTWAICRAEAGGAPRPIEGPRAPRAVPPLVLLRGLHRGNSFDAGGRSDGLPARARAAAPACRTAASISSTSTRTNRRSRGGPVGAARDGARVQTRHRPRPSPRANPAAIRIVERLRTGITSRFQLRPDYFLTVRGDCMDRTGLRDGDIVAIHKTPTAESGQVVVAGIRRRGHAEASSANRRAPRRSATREPQPRPTRS